MKIKLIRKGGLIPLKKEAETEVEWSQDEFDQLVKTIQVPGNAAGKKRDATTYHLEKDEQQVPVDLEKLPGKYNKVFETLKDKLEVVK